MKYFTLEELCASSTARKKSISNKPTPEAKENLHILVEKVLDPARERLGAPISVNSGYRCPALNKAVGGAATSQHMRGQAADLRCKQMAKLYGILESMDVDQLLYEHKGRTTWIHVSYNQGNNRNQKIKNYKA